MKRRTLLKASLLTAAIGALPLPRTANGAYPTRAFLAKDPVDALREAFGNADMAETDKIEIEAPHIASDPNIVPVKVRSGFENTESISIVVAANESPFTAHFRLYEKQAFVSTRLRLADSGEVLVVVKADGLLHARSLPIRVGRNECKV